MRMMFNGQLVMRLSQGLPSVRKHTSHVLVYDGVCITTSPIPVRVKLRGAKLND